nr:histidine phosphatase family protein [Streptococcus macedonicus]
MVEWKESQSYLHPNREPNQKGHGDFYLKYDGESETQVRERVSDTVFRLVSQSDDDATILAVSHSGAIMSFFSALKLENHPELHFSLQYHG